MTLKGDLENEEDKKGLSGKEKDEYVGGTINKIKRKRAFSRKDPKLIEEWEKEHGRKYQSWVDGEIKTPKQKQREERKRQKEEQAEVTKKRDEEYNRKRNSLLYTIESYERILPRMKQDRDNANKHNMVILRENAEKTGKKISKKDMRVINENNAGIALHEKSFSDAKIALKKLDDDFKEST